MIIFDGDTTNIVKMRMKHGEITVTPDPCSMVLGV